MDTLTIKCKCAEAHCDVTITAQQVGAAVELTVKDGLNVDMQTFQPGELEGEILPHGAYTWSVYVGERNSVIIDEKDRTALLRLAERVGV